MKLIRRIAGKKLSGILQFQILDYVEPTSSRVDPDVIRKLKSAFCEMDKDAHLVPIIMPAGTDARRLRMKGKVAYGFVPFLPDEGTDFDELLSLPH